MAAAITTTATTIEGQFLEIAAKIQELELAVPVDTRPNNMTLTPDLEGLVMNVTASIPITYSVDASANVVISSGTYLT